MKTRNIFQQFVFKKKMFAISLSGATNASAGYKADKKVIK